MKQINTLIIKIILLYYKLPLKLFINKLLNNELFFQTTTFT